MLNSVTISKFPGGFLDNAYVCCNCCIHDIFTKLHKHLTKLSKIKQIKSHTKYADLLLHIYSLQHTASKKNQTAKTAKEILTEDIKVGISKDVAMFVAGVALQHLCVGLGHVHITHIVVGNNTSPIWRQICQNNQPRANSDVPYQKISKQVAAVMAAKSCITAAPLRTRQS